jgi:hypothetical protein
MHAERMRAVAQAIREYPQNFDMLDFLLSRDGGTMSVERATAALEDDESDAESIKLAREYLQWFIRNEDLESDDCGTTGCIAGFAVWLFDRDRLLHRSQWSEKGRRVLGLTKTQAEELFLMERQNGESLWERAVERRIIRPLAKLELPYVDADSAADVLDALAVGDLEFSTDD